MSESSAKDTNPKDAVGVKKVSFSCLPLPPLYGVALAMQEGARKYGRHNYRDAGVRASVYFDASLRHKFSWWEGQNFDPDSGAHHLDKEIAGLLVLRDSMIRGNWVDDRPPASDPELLARANETAAEIVARYPNALMPFTQEALDAAESRRTIEEFNDNL